MKNVIFFEMALVVGKLFAMAGTLVILFIVPQEFQWQAIFVLAGVFTLLYGVL